VCSGEKWGSVSQGVAFVLGATARWEAYDQYWFDGEGINSNLRKFFRDRNQKNQFSIV